MVMNQRNHDIFPACRKIMGPEAWHAVMAELPQDTGPDGFAAVLAHYINRFSLPPYLPDLARLEAQANRCLVHENLDFQPDTLCVNPSLALVQTDWRNLPALIRQKGVVEREPSPGEDYVLVLLHPESGALTIRSAKPDELLALKIVIEQLNKKEIAQSQVTTLASLDRAMEHAVRRGILLRPRSAIKRDQTLFASDLEIPRQFLEAQVFTLQWHITQTCDLRCKHCYDRSSRSSLPLADAIDVLDQLYDFCQARYVLGQVSLSGGNPLLHPDFFAIYQAAADRGFMTAILGNPTTPDILARIQAIQQPEFYQVSLEGLQPHNDYIRGDGFFDRVMTFLDDLRSAGIYSMVMLTLTRANMDQVLPLVEMLRNRADLFTFNRLSMVGEGAQLLTPRKEEFETFLKAYLDAERENPVMALKDNLINIIRYREGQDPFGGCAGFGCGAAFNFVALLPDGEVHACRKFPSPIGNLYKQRLAAIYDSAEADRYRKGPSSCNGCRIRHVCGGCLAVIHSQGLDLTLDRDPCCFMEHGPGYIS